MTTRETELLAALKAELREICAAIDDPANDLTLTTVECIKKLKAENEWRDIETAPKDCDVLVTDGSKVYLGRWVGRYFAWGYSTDPTHWKPLPKPPAMVQGE